MFRFSTKGNSYDRGTQQGKACGDLAYQWIEIKLMEIANALSPASVDTQVSALRKSFEKHYSEGYEECCGIANGLNLAESKYFTAVSHFKLLLQLNACSSVGFVTDEGNPLFGKTDDFGFDSLGLNVLEITQPDKGYRYVQSHYAGTIWTITGMNETGFCMGMTAIPGYNADDGLFTLDSLHKFLPVCSDVESAEALLKEITLNYYGYSLMMADAKGNLALWEKNTSGCVKLPLQNGYYYHSNHILNPELAEKSPPQIEPLNTNSNNRVTRIQTLLEHYPKTYDGLCKIMTDAGETGSLLQRGDENMHTDFMVLYNPVMKQMEMFTDYPDFLNREIICMSKIFG